MKTVIGIAVILAGLIGWVGQALSFFASAVATKLGLCEVKGEIDLVLYLIETKAFDFTDTALICPPNDSGHFSLADSCPCWR